jgi:hypothetical protein
MPGFGQGPFGGGSGHAFGEWKWSRQLFYDFLPEFYRLQDAETGGLLEQWLDALRGPFDELRLLIRDLEELRDPLLVRNNDTDVVTLRLGEVRQSRGEVEQRGIAGKVLTAGVFQASTARFTQGDRDKILVISKSADSRNNREYQIASVLNKTQVVTEPEIFLDAGPLTWEVRAPVDSGVVVQVRSGNVSGINIGWLLNDGEADFEVLERRRFLRDETRPVIEKHGANGAIDSSGFFTSPLAGFTTRDLGKRVSIQGTTDAEEEGTYEVMRVVSSDTLELGTLGGPAVALTQDAGPLTWQLRPLPELELSGTPKGVIELGGVDLEVLGASTVQAPSATFTATDVGKPLRIENSSLGNDGVYNIASVTDQTTAVLDTVALVAETDLDWSLRAATLRGDLTQVEVRAPSLLAYLAQDFGIVVDNQETEDRQRSWVAAVSKWIGIKGLEAGYEVLGALSGFVVDAKKLYRVRPGFLAIAPSPSNYIEVGAEESGRAGSDGSLVSTAGAIQLTSPTATFDATDDIRLLRIENSASNDGLYSIVEAVDANTLTLSPGQGLTPPDGNNGAITWSVVQLYTDLPPTLPLFDEMNVDLLHEIVDTESVGALAFHVDKYCWEADWSSDVSVGVLSVTLIDTNRYSITVEENTTFGPYTDFDTLIQAIGNWTWVDADGTAYLMETLPTESSPGEFTFEVVAGTAPSSTYSSSYWRYSCPENSTCSYCASSTILVTAEVGAVASEPPLAQQKLWERLFTRLLQVKPAHVRMIFQRQQILEATWTITAEVEAIGTAEAIMYAPFTVIDGDVPEDTYPADTAIKAVVEAPAQLATMRGQGSMSGTGSVT